MKPFLFGYVKSCVTLVMISTYFTKITNKLSIKYNVILMIMHFKVLHLNFLLNNFLVSSKNILNEFKTHYTNNPGYAFNVLYTKFYFFLMNYTAEDFSLGFQCFGLLQATFGLTKFGGIAVIGIINTMIMGLTGTWAMILHERIPVSLDMYKIFKIFGTILDVPDIGVFVSDSRTWLQIIESSGNYIAVLTFALIGFKMSLKMSLDTYLNLKTGFTIVLVLLIVYTLMLLIPVVTVLSSLSFFIIILSWFVHFINIYTCLMLTALLIGIEILLCFIMIRIAGYFDLFSYVLTHPTTREKFSEKFKTKTNGKNLSEEMFELMSIIQSSFDMYVLYVRLIFGYTNASRMNNYKQNNTILISSVLSIFGNLIFILSNFLLYFHRKLINVLIKYQDNGIFGYKYTIYFMRESMRFFDEPDPIKFKNFYIRGGGILDNVLMLFDHVITSTIIFNAYIVNAVLYPLLGDVLDYGEESIFVDLENKYRYKEKFLLALVLSILYYLSGLLLPLTGVILSVILIFLIFMGLTIVSIIMGFSKHHNYITCIIYDVFLLCENEFYCYFGDYNEELKEFEKLEHPFYYYILEKTGFITIFINCWLLNRDYTTLDKSNKVVYATYYNKDKILKHFNCRSMLPLHKYDLIALFRSIIRKRDYLRQISVWTIVLSLVSFYFIRKMCFKTLTTASYIIRRIFDSILIFILIIMLPNSVYGALRGSVILMCLTIKARFYDTYDTDKQTYHSVLRNITRYIKTYANLLRLSMLLGSLKVQSMDNNTDNYIFDEDLLFLQDMENIKYKIDNKIELTDIEEDLFENIKAQSRYQMLRTLIKELRLKARPGHLKFYKNNWVNLTRMAVKKFVMRLDSFRLPEFIQSQYQSPTVESIKSTYMVLQDMGFPIDQGFIDSIRAPNDSDYLAEWASLKQWLIGVSDFKTGLPKIRAGFDWIMADFGFDNIPGYMHTSTFTGKEEELRSTSRYWTKTFNLDKYSTDEINDVITATYNSIKAQYGNPQLSSPEFIFKHWVKRYNAGFGFRIPIMDKKKTDIIKRWKQMRRSYLIEKLGGRKGFLEKFKTLFKYAPSMTSVAPVFTKMETLKIKKQIARAVRTVVGSAFVHHVSSTIFNFKPNHNYKPFETPMKVGMSINGQSFDKIWTSLLKHDKIWAGDMTAFDSSLPPPIVKLIAEVRKMSYKDHFDHHRISVLIDLCYNELISQPLGFKAWGDIASKHKGLSTGHSSTTPDNSIALIVVYLLAWRKITGLRSREFFNYNTLANFGDDHVLGFDEVFGWHPMKAAKVMADFGIIMRDEGEGQNALPNKNTRNSGRDNKISFLSKKPLFMSPEILFELKNCGVDIPLNFATCHDKDRLIGKIKGQVDLAKDDNYKYQRMVSFMYLCPHHKDVYERLDYILNKLEARNKRRWVKMNYKPQKKPTYQEVVRKWYEKGLDNKVMDMDDIEHDEHEEFVITYEASSFDYMVRWLSDVPTMLSPRYTNTRWADWIQIKSAKFISWPLTFINKANKCHNDTKIIYDKMSRTPYNFLRMPNLKLNPDLNITTLYVRHYIFMLYSSIFGRRRYGFSLLDYVRVLDHAFINLLFMITGKVTTILVELDLHIFDILMIILLDKIHIKIDFMAGISKWMLSFDPISPSSFVGLVITMLVQKFSPSGSIDFQPLYAILENLNNEGPISVGAPTGVGKSTRLVNNIQEKTRKRVVVIVPRRIVAINVGEYMQKLYPASGIEIQTEGYTARRTGRIIYCTAQSFLIIPWLRDPNNLIILDEAHVFEPVYNLVSMLLIRDYKNCIFMTATPLNTWTIPHLDIPSLSSFKVLEYEFDIEDEKEYFDRVTGFVNSRDTNEKFLIFVPTKKEQYILFNQIIHPVCILNSENTVIDEKASVYLSTNVADAGLTIPDVSFVFTMDMELEFRYMTQDRIPTLPQPVVISKQTIKQRKGRTGRTIDGMFYLFRVRKYHKSIVGATHRPYTFSDYYNAVGLIVDDYMDLLPNSAKVKEEVMNDPLVAKELLRLGSLPESSFGIKNDSYNNIFYTTFITKYDHLAAYGHDITYMINTAKARKNMIAATDAIREHFKIYNLWDFKDIEAIFGDLTTDLAFLTEKKREERVAAKGAMNKLIKMFTPTEETIEKLRGQSAYQSTPYEYSPIQKKLILDDIIEEQVTEVKSFNETVHKAGVENELLYPIINIEEYCTPNTFDHMNITETLNQDNIIWENVSGSGLLCGIYSIGKTMYHLKDIGVAENFDVNTYYHTVLDSIRNVYIPIENEEIDLNNFFDYGSLNHVLEYLYDITIALWDGDQNRWIFDQSKKNFICIRLSGAHYNASNTYYIKP